MAHDGRREARVDEPAAAEELVGAPEQVEASVLELCVSNATPPEPARVDGVVIGVLMGFSDDGEPLVALPWHPAGSAGIVARAAAELAPKDAGAEVATLFEGGRPDRPIVVGKLAAPRSVASARTVEAPVEIEADGEPVVVSAEHQLVLKCGKASITLTKAGKVLIRGEYVLTRSTGANRIVGGSVQIN